MTAQIQTDEDQENGHVLRINVTEIGGESGRSRSISDHVQNGTQFAALIQITRSMAVQSIQKARNCVKREEQGWI